MSRLQLAARTCARITHARDQIADTLDNLELLLRQVEERTFPDPLDADPPTAYDHWLEYGFLDQLRNAPPATADAVYDSYQYAYREQQSAAPPNTSPC